MMVKRTLLTLLSTATAQQQPSWHRFATNINYRLTGLIDINGGSPNSGSESETAGKTPGYSIPIEVLTLYNHDDDKYYQRISYYSDTHVEYNIDGAGYSVGPTPYGHDYGVSDSSICFQTSGSKTKTPYLNFFPTVGQMSKYTVGGLVTSEAGIPYRRATLESSHGSHESMHTSSDMPSDYELGMPSNDWFELTYQESLHTGAISSNSHAIPLKWTMLARNQIINAHTEHWVIRYLSYTAIDGHDKLGVWNDWLKMSYDADCGDSNAVELAEGHTLKMNRLAMFFSSSLGVQDVQSKKVPSQFDSFMALHNKQYSSDEEYLKRKSIHDSNVNKIHQWNQEHAGKTSFVHNEFLDLELQEVMKFRGGHIPVPRLDKVKRAAAKKSKAKNNFLRLTSDEDVDVDDYNYTVYEVPDDFDASTLPKEFDWRAHLPGSISPIKDQGFCGSCWAFSFISSLESHWFITNSQSVKLPEQFVNDCLWTDDSFGCDGGQSYVAAVAVLERFGGMVPIHDTYGSYLSVDGQCYVDILQGLGMLHGQESLLSQDKSKSPAVQMTDWVILPERDETAIKHALLNRGPLSVGFNVVGESLYYSNGVLDVDSCTANTADDLDHAINLIGWGVDTLDDGTEAQHWILRNSWSTIWGDEGYFRVRMGERDCGVSADPGFPVVAKVAHVAAVE